MQSICRENKAGIKTVPRGGSEGRAHSLLCSFLASQSELIPSLHFITLLIRLGGSVTISVALNTKPPTSDNKINFAKSTVAKKYVKLRGQIFGCRN